jgi:hypothetical protein
MRKQQPSSWMIHDSLLLQVLLQAFPLDVVVHHTKLELCSQKRSQEVVLLLLFLSAVSVTTVALQSLATAAQTQRAEKGPLKKRESKSVCCWGVLEPPKKRCVCCCCSRSPPSLPACFWCFSLPDCGEGGARNTGIPGRGGAASPPRPPHPGRPGPRFFRQ